MPRILFLICCCFCVAMPKVFGQLNAQLLGNAIDQGNNCFLITPDDYWKYGAVWYDNPIDFTTDFQIVFDAFFGIHDMDGADGMALVFKTNSTPELGDAGFGIGYRGISPSLAVEFDTYYNNMLSNDPIADHIGLMLNGNTDHNTDLAIAELPNLEDGSFHEIKVVWDAAAQEIIVLKDCVQIISYIGDIVNLALNGNTIAYFGFTGSTGALSNEQRICFKYISFIENLNLQDQDICIGDAVDTIDATISGAVSYNWTPTVGVSDPTSPNPVFSPNTTTTYQVEIHEQCGNIYTKSFTINVHSYLSAVATTYSQCDDVSNDGQALFNLTLDSIKREINENYVNEGLDFTYFENEIDAETNANAITTPEAYQDAPGFTPETVWVRVEDPNGCYSVVPLTLKVNPYSGALLLYNPATIYQCDDGMDTSDGIATFDLTEFKDYIEHVIFPTIITSAHFYETRTDAELEINEIVNFKNYQNVNSPNSQDIWVRVESNLGNDCLDIGEFPDLLVVEALPVANQVSLERQCDDDFDGAYPFDVSTLESSVLGAQSTDDVNLTYLDSSSNPLKDFNGNLVTSPLPNTLLMDSQTITIRVTNINSNDPDGPCYDETSLAFIVDPQPVANYVIDQIACDGDAEDIDDDGLFPFDTSMIETAILNGQIGMELQYYDTFGGVLPSPLPNPFITGTQTLRVEIINSSNMACTNSTEITFIVNPIPEFTIATPQIVCTSDPTFTILLDPDEASPSEVYTYAWSNEFGEELSSDPTFEVSTPGRYFVTLTDTFGTGCSRTREIAVNPSELATITTQDLKIVQISDNNSITINNGNNNLGLGDYEFALNQITGPYQDEPFFEHLGSGKHTLFVRDKNGCGIASLEVFILGFPKFFTPNNDGYHDTWNIQGLSNEYTERSMIYIFDRYGKLLKQINPRGYGWDGLYQGRKLNSSDYWFVAYLENINGSTSTYRGHFSLVR